MGRGQQRDSDRPRASGDEVSDDKPHEEEQLRAPIDASPRSRRDRPNAPLLAADLLCPERAEREFAGEAEAPYVPTY